MHEVGCPVGVLAVLGLLLALRGVSAQPVKAGEGAYLLGPEVAATRACPPRRCAPRPC